VSTSNVAVNEDIVYTLIIEGGSPDRLPSFPKVEGLFVDFAGRSSQTVGTFSKFTHTVTYRYRLTPERQGELRIPPIEVIVDGEKLSTQPITLKVAPPAKVTGAGDYAFAELRLARQHAYVGEDVPVDLIYYLESRSRWGMGGSAAPRVDGEGYSTRQLAQGDQSRVEIGGKQYVRVLFRTAITPNRAGKLTIGPVPLRLMYSKLLSGENDRFGGVYEGQKQVSVTAPAVDLEVKPLPVEGRPKDFSGGIGKFRFSAEGRPDRVKIGEPLSMTLQIEGQGNFDRIGAPALAEPEGWRSYPPNDRFEPADPQSLTGTKAFQVVVVPETKKNTMPVFNFSYFDPEQAKYITLTSAATPLVVEGEVPPPAAVPPAPVESAAPPKAEAAQDIVGIRPLPGFWGTMWTPPPALSFSLLFAPAPILAALLFWRARRSDPRAATRAALHREKSALLVRIRATEDRAELFDAAARVLQIEVALATGQPGAGIDEATILARSDAPAVRRLFAARAELVYAGGESGRATTADRDQALEALDQFGKGKR
jgi:hypothetical protein